MDEECPLVLGSLDPFERDRMILGDIATHVENDIGIPEINIMIGHCTASERLCQSRYSRAVSDTGLVFNVNQSQRSEKLLVKPAFFVIQSGAAYRGNPIRAVDGSPVGIPLHKARLSTLFDVRCDLIEGPLPTYLFPGVAVRSSIADLLKAIVVHSDLIARGSLGAKGAFADGVIRVSLSIDHFSLAVGVDDDPAPNGTITADREGLFRPFDSEFLSIGLDR